MNPAVKIIKTSKEKAFEQPLHDPVKIPEKITSHDNLFDGGILSNIVEYEVDDSSEEEEGDNNYAMNLSAQGFPVATRRIVKENVPNAPALPVYESGKIEWATDASDASEKVDLEVTTVSKLRFGLKGQILSNTSKERFVGDALYHHGDEPEQAGYTIVELLHLSKSTVSSQRVLSLNILTCIGRKMICDQYTLTQKEAILPLIRCSGEPLLAARVGLDSNNETVIDAALSLISIYLGLESEILEAFDDILLVERGFRSIALEDRTFKLFMRKTEKNEDDTIDMNVESILAKLVSDPIFGLVLSNILTRLRYLLATNTLSSSGQTTKALYILTCVALHSPACSEDILACEGLIDILKVIAARCIQNAHLDTSLSLTFLYLIRLFRLLATSSREACSALVKDGVVDLVFGCFSQSQLDPSLCKQALLMLNVTICYSLGGFLLDKYHSCILNTFLSLVQTEYSPTESSLSPSRGMLTFVSAISKLLHDAIDHFGSSLDIGGESDMFAPFADIFSRLILDVKLESTSDGLLLKANSLKFLNNYVSKAMEKQKVSFGAQKVIDRFPVHTAQLSRELAHLFSTGDQENFANRAVSSNVENFIAAGSFVELLESSSLERVAVHSAYSKTGGFGSAVFMGLLYCAKRNSLSKQSLLDMDAHAGIRHYLQDFSKVSGDIGITGFDRIFLVIGLGHFLRAFLNYHDYMLQKYKGDTLSLPESKDFAAVIISSALPGDDYLIEEVMMKELGSEFFSTRGSSFLSLESVQESKRLFGIPGASRAYPSSFVVECNGSASVLPFASFDWIYTFPTELYLERKRLQRYNILEDWLLMILRLEEGGSCLVNGIKVSSKIGHLLHIYLLYTCEGEPLFRSGDEIPKVLPFLFSIIPWWTPNTCKELNSSPSFFGMYEELIDQFLAESFGDSAFARMLILPLSPHFSPRFRSLFFSKINLKYLGYFAFPIEQFCHNRVTFDELFPKDLPESDSSLINLYKIILSKPDKMRPDTIIFSILTSALECVA